LRERKRGKENHPQKNGCEPERQTHLRLLRDVRPWDYRVVRGNEGLRLAF
jgi:hypothetical protein